MSVSDVKVGGDDGVEKGVEEEGEEGAVEPADKLQWSDASKLLFQPGYLKVLKSMAISGQLQLYNIRSVVWRLFLHVLPEDQLLWVTATTASRAVYSKMKQKHVMDPHQVTASLDIALNNPLSQSEYSPWNRFFQDNELRQLISQDVVRTFPDVQFFQQDNIQQMMEDILFCYVREHPHLGYRQGMHELLAPILFVMHAELRDTQDDPSLAPVLRDVMDPAFIEHDTYALFAELMEMVEPWYSAVGLEADQVKARQQVASSQRKNMTQDPRTSKPFEEDNAGPSSAISRKLDVVHNVLLKKADQVLYLHLKQLSIPAQTYGIRWIRLLFGREFPLPSVLEVWDAVFADGPSLVDYMCVAMLMHIREVLIEGDYATCMHHLMHFPTVYEVNYLVQRSLHLRNPAVHPSPSLWSHHPHHKLQQAPSNPPHITPPFTQVAPHTHQQSLQQPHASRAKQAGAKAKQVLSTAGRQLASGIKRKDGAESKVSPPPSGNVPSPSPPPLMASPTTVAKESKKGRGKIIGDLYESKEMKKNPKISPSPHSLGQLERLTSRVDDLEAKIAYCGSKMDSLLMAMEDEVAELTAEIQLQPETENTLLLSLAGLKHVRDILLNKICFSGAMLTDEHNAVAHRQPDVLNGAHLQGMSIPTPTLQTLQEPISITRGNRCVTPPMEEPSVMEPHPLMSSGEMEGRDEWVNLSTSQHPLVSSD